MDNSIKDMDNRIKELQKENIIKKYLILRNEKNLIKYQQKNIEIYNEFEKRLNDIESNFISIKSSDAI